MSGRRTRRGRNTGRRRLVLVTVVVVVVAALAIAVVLSRTVTSPTSPSLSSSSSSLTSSPTTSASKYDILYVDQGNGAVNESNFGTLLSVASSHGFNTIFFQVYREGDLLFDSGQLLYFVQQAHSEHIELFFSLYFTDSASQQLPTSVYSLGEDGISLDMSSLPVANQSFLFQQLKQAYGGTNAITTTDPTLPLTPDLLILETYGASLQPFSQDIHPGMIASVGVFATTSRSDYEQELSYALQNSDGVMVFDYAGLLKSGY